MRANDDGEFLFGDLSMERYELSASHPDLGHGVRRIDPDGQPIDIDLRQERMPRLRSPTPQ